LARGDLRRLFRTRTGFQRRGKKAAAHFFWVVPCRKGCFLLTSAREKEDSGNVAHACESRFVKTGVTHAAEGKGVSMERGFKGDVAQSTARQNPSTRRHGHSAQAASVCSRHDANGPTPRKRPLQSTPQHRPNDVRVLNRHDAAGTKARHSRRLWPVNQPGPRPFPPCSGRMSRSRLPRSFE
jgi:hypothetical protein